MSQNNASNTQDDFQGNEWAELLKTGLIAVVIALFVRTLFFEPFNIPSGSMKPGLLVGDYLYVSKYSYGYSAYSMPLIRLPIEGRIMAKQPERGDVVVFKLPTDGKTDYIKRVIGLPGDTVQVRGGQLYLNGERLPRKKVGSVSYEKPINMFMTGEVEATVYRQTLPNGVSFKIWEETDNGPLDNTEIYTVPEGHFFMMGDNRDNSTDSRVQARVGYVPFENMIGRAERIFFSLDADTRIFEVWKWPWNIRYDRLLDPISAR